MFDRRYTFIGIAVIALALLAFTRYSLPLNPNDITPDSFYRGSKEVQKIDPKSYYRSLMGLDEIEGDTEKNCKPVIKYSDKDNVQLGPDSIVFTENVNITSESILSSSSFSGFNDGDVLLAPKNSGVFKNTNILRTTLDDTQVQSIEIKYGTAVVLRFYDVKCWWCHNHNPSVTEHTTVIGANTNYESCAIGQIIGKANPTTKVELWVVSDMDKMTVNQANATFIQADLGKWLRTGEIVPLTQ